MGALLPDLDAEDSTIQHELGGLGAFTKLGMKLLGIQHRGFLHSGVAVMLVMVVSIILGRKFGYIDVGFAFGLGFMSHILLADAMTISGVPLLWPSENKFHLLPAFLRIRTGGPVESLVSILTMIALVYMSPALVPDNFFKILRNILS